MRNLPLVDEMLRIRQAEAGAERGTLRTLAAARYRGTRERVDMTARVRICVLGGI